VIQAREQPTDIGTFSDPRLNGATLQVALAGATPSDETFNLPAGGWEAVGGGYRYTRPMGMSPSDPVRRVLLKQTPSGMARIKIVLQGTPNLQLVPPNPGDEAHVVLAVTNGDRYCTALGGAAGGSEVADTATQWKVNGASVEVACPTPPALPPCFQEFSPCGTCGDGICVQHLAGPPSFVCASQSGFGTGTCSSNAECTDPRVCYLPPGPPCPGGGSGFCGVPCNSDVVCEAESAGFCASVTCVGVLCTLPCP
jgi:hypothetical protein